MPQIKARYKHIRQTHKRTRRNRKLKDEIKYTTRAALAAAASGDEQQVQETLNRAYKSIDKAAKVGVFPARRGARRKSLLARQVAGARSAQ